MMGASRAPRTKKARRGRKGVTNSFLTPLGSEILRVANLIPKNQVFPPHRKTVLQYAENFALTMPNTGLAASQVYALNGLSAIDVTNTTGTPYEWSKITPLWNQYCVLRCKGIITFLTQTVASTQESLFCGIQLRGPNPAGLTYSAVVSRPGSKSLVLTNNGEGRVVIPFDLYIPDAFGRSLEVYRADYGAAVSAQPGAGSPDYTCLLSVWAIDANSTSLVVAGTAQFEFEVELFDQLL